MEANTIPSHCTAHYKCWECAQGWLARVLTKDIELAIGLVVFRGEIVAQTFSDDHVEALERAIWLLRQLMNRQWREMVRQPFLFDSPLKKALEKSTLTIDDLGLDL